MVGDTLAQIGLPREAFSILLGNMAAAEAVLRLRSKFCYGLIPYPWYLLHPKIKLSNLSNREVRGQNKSVKILLVNPVVNDRKAQ